MGARNWHVSRAKHHFEVAEHLSQKYLDWAAVALFYSALHYVHSSLADEPTLLKDERHPRKHTAPAGQANAGRGVNQLVRDLYGGIQVSYISLFELSRRTRYDVHQLGGLTVWPLLKRQHHDVETFCVNLNNTRPPMSTQAP